MAKKQLRTVKKSSNTGRLDRAAVRSAVTAARGSGQYAIRGNDGGSIHGTTSGASKSQHPAKEAAASSSCRKS